MLVANFYACNTHEKEKFEIHGELKKWHKVTFVFNGIESNESASINPFLDYRLEMEFSKGNISYIVPGYFAADGNAAESSAQKGTKWKVHFRPEEVGEWSYRVSFRTGSDIAVSNNKEMGEATVLDGLEGTIIISDADKTGNDFRSKGKIVNGHKGYLKYSEKDELFIKNGTDSPENFLAFADFDQTYRYGDGGNRDGEAQTDKQIHNYAPHLDDWITGDPIWKKNKGRGIIGAINYLSSKGVNSIYMLTLNIQGDGKDVWPYINHNERYRFDCSKLEQWEIVFDHMERKGVLMHLVMQETENECLLDIGYTEVQRKLYLRELSARFGHHLGIIWNIGEENGAADWTPIGQTDQQRKDMANYIKSINPYHPIVLVHTHADDHGQDKYLEPLLGFSNLDGASMQIANPERVNERIQYWIKKSESTNKRWLVNMDELGPHWKGVMPDVHDSAHDTIRHHALWGSLLAGSGGVEWYFGWKYPETDLSCEDFRSRDLWWHQSTIATEFLSSLPLENMVSSNNLINLKNAYCLAKPGNVYVIYKPKGSSNLKLEIDANQAFSIKWFNPRLGGPLQDGSVLNVRGNGNIDIGKPLNESDKDWVALVRLVI